MSSSISTAFNPLGLSKEFLDYLQSIRIAKFQADSLLDVLAPGHAMAEASIGVVWESVFKYLCDMPKQTQDMDVGVLNTLSGILQKLMSSLSQLRTIENKIKDAADDSPLAKQAAAAIELKQGISLETLRTIESKLKLL